MVRCGTRLVQIGGYFPQHFSNMISINYMSNCQTNTVDIYRIIHISEKIQSLLDHFHSMVVYETEFA